MGRPRKIRTIENETQKIIKPTQTAQEALMKQNTGRCKVIMRPVMFYEVLITHPDYSFENHLYNEKGIEYVVKTQKKGGE